MKVIISTEELEKIKAHGSESFPDEACGVMIGNITGTSENGGVVEVLETRRMRNINVGNPNRRYDIDPRDLMKMEDYAEDKKLELVGIYHSHPNHPSTPSQYDLNHAWPNLSYLILSVQQGTPAKVDSWRLTEDRTRFFQEIIEIQ